ncbi:MAG: hypothetical protein ACRDJJ_00715 [Actinomycetota bacterium]
MSCVLERTVARANGVREERDLSEAAADFYLMENLVADGDGEARRALARHEEELAREFSCYLDVAVGGELRYARRHLGDDALPRELRCYFTEIGPGHRGKAWMVWTVVRRALGPRALILAEEVFSHDGWRENFGGSAWACVSRLLRSYLVGELMPRIFVDQCLSLEHNTGSVFNKLFDTTKLARVLVAQSEDDFERLLAHASGQVRRRWRLREWRKRQEHDPIWLGVQILDTYDELVGKEEPA